ncbi:MAG: MBL fold metallo-hydrolase [Bacteroidota bacterium]
MVVLAVIPAIIVLFILTAMLFTRLPHFGRQPQGQRLQLIKQSPNFRDGAFQNLSHTPNFAEGVTMTKAIKGFFFNKSKQAAPPRPLPTMKTDLLHLNPAKDVFVWFGHSGYFMQVGGVRFLVDPVMSGAASPVSFTTRAFPGSDVYSPADMPEVDYLIITHDHWDHLDYKTVLALKPKVKHIITSLGVGQHLERWGFDKAKFTETDWWDETPLSNGFKLTTTPARHFSGRGFKRNQAIWSSFVLQTARLKIFIGGDSGHDSHFKAIGDKFGPFDIAILECGQYHEYWRYIHMLPPEVVQAAQELKAKALLPVHWAKFSLSLHAWDEPIIKVTEAAAAAGQQIVTPMIGEEVDLNHLPASGAWWKDIG